MTQKVGQAPKGELISFLCFFGGCALKSSTCKLDLYTVAWASVLVSLVFG
ncbi:hypothetical protein SpiGrapes_2631 [Sphaerochaeta pleomorpha str. Grapes]|uniref:Uncharacterized protein n=1 Tax=Sphaerochaeta pleomorpha (strain ATCC BAA-1885 / DSM 22778 / Grapes) TaxID=158190 RepID=G8QV76_SPHPG|nr:hypothetical protein SpiGrapes_2631 [Sphaerochaeta pleomorpha str. Grapes]